MAQITINEVSQNYSYNIGTSSYCTVALPITACWGPAYEDPASLGISLDEELEQCRFTHFSANQDGLEAFIAAYRGPASNYRLAKDYSYYIALTLLTAGYDVATCRLCPGSHAQATFNQEAEEGQTPGSLVLRAKYPGTFGNNLQVAFNKVPNRNYWNLITYVVDANGTKSAVENLIFVFNIEDSTDSILHVSEIESSFLDIIPSGLTSDEITFSESVKTLVGGSDKAADGPSAAAMIADAVALVNTRFDLAPGTDPTDYIAALNAAGATADATSASIIKYKEWIYTHTMHVLDILKDKLTYSCKRIILPGWDDQDISEFSGSAVTRLNSLNPLHVKLMDVAYYSRCAAAYIDIPKSLARSGVWIDSPDASAEGYAQKLSNYVPVDINDGLYATHSALFAPWGQYTYSGTGKQAIAPPGLLALLIERAMILNQSTQYEWAQPTSRKHNLNIGKLSYNVPKKLLDQWQSQEGVSLNVIADIPDLGVSVWGNSTLFNVPVATENALQNLSTRKLVNALEDVAYRAGISITFQYNNDEAYSKFYAACSPLCDTMRTQGAILDYKIKMGRDINGLDSVSSNSIIGRIYIQVQGVINDITIDLIALPASADLSAI